MTNAFGSEVRKLKVLITVKTYPTLSSSYGELVCTAGVTEEGEWIRIYPVPFRKLDDLNRYPKYAWVEFDGIRHTRDFRPQSYRPVDPNAIKIVSKVEADGGAWIARRQLITDKVKVYTNLTELINDSKKANGEDLVSLTMFKPTEILDFYHKPSERQWDSAKLQKALQPTLFDQADFSVVPKIPYQFKFRFRDDAGKESNLMIEDWETGQLYLNSLKGANGNEEVACQKVKEKYFDNFAKTKDLHFYLGTMFESHRRNFNNPFTIIGAFYPKKLPPAQPSLFDFMDE